MPALPAEIRQYIAPAASAGNEQDSVIYLPFLVAGGEVHFFNNRAGIATSEPLAHVLPLSPDSAAIDWADARACAISAGQLGGVRMEHAAFGELPPLIRKVSAYNKLDKQYETHVYRTFKLELRESKRFKKVSRPGESARDFRIRLTETAHEQRDLETERLKRKYAGKVATLERQLNTAQQQLDRESDQYSQKKMDIAFSVGSTLLGALLGGGSRRGVTSAARSASKISKEKRDIARAEAKVAAVQERIQKLDAQFDAEVRRLGEKYDPMQEPLTPLRISAKKSDVVQKYYGILWVPYEKRSNGEVVSLNPQVSG